MKLLLLPPLVKGGGMKALQRKICMQPKLYTNKYTFEMRALLYKATRICTTFSAHAPSYFHSPLCIYIYIPSLLLAQQLIVCTLGTHFHISFDRNCTPFAPCRQKTRRPFLCLLGCCRSKCMIFAHA